MFSRLAVAGLPAVLRRIAWACGGAQLLLHATFAEGLRADGAPAPRVHAVIPRAAAPPMIDGRLDADEYRGALGTPLEYFNADVENRPAQFFYLWDDQAFYVGLRTLDKHAYAPETPLWEGDAVEWYFDARPGADFLSAAWPKEPNPGAVHCFFTPLRLDKIEPRFALRPGYENAMAKIGVQVAATRSAAGLEVEFKMPWANFPQFEPADGKIIALDAELSYSDGGPRSFRSFVFGGPLSVQQPANLARVRLVDRFERSDWPICGPVMAPLRVDVPWNQTGTPQTVARIALPPGRSEEVGDIVFRLTNLSGDVLGDFRADRQVDLDASGAFVLREAHWPTDTVAPGEYQVTAIVNDAQGHELTRVAPRLASVNMAPGY